MDELIEDLEAGVKEWEEGGLFDVVKHFSIHIMHHIIEVSEDIHGAAKYWHAEMYYESGLNVGDLLGVLINQS